VTIIDVDDQYVLTDSMMAINLYYVHDLAHASSMLMRYFPTGRLLTDADLYFPDDRRTITSDEPQGHAAFTQNLLLEHHISQAADRLHDADSWEARAVQAVPRVRADVDLDAAVASRNGIKGCHEGTRLPLARARAGCCVARARCRGPEPLERHDWRRHEGRIGRCAAWCHRRSVESSPSLIEKVPTVVTDNGGVYRIVDLRPGVYTVTFSLQGFSTLRREGIELFIASPARLRVFGRPLRVSE
jgi:hypothetical protein